MEDVLRFLKEYKKIYKTEIFVSIVVSIITLLVLLCFFSYQIFINKNDKESSTTIANAFIGLGSTGIITVAIGYIYKFMDKAMEAAERFVNNQNNNQNAN